MRTRTAGFNRNTETLHVRGMDAEAVKEDVTEAVKQRVEWDDERWKITEMRPQANNTQAITLTIGTKEAKKILGDGILTVGMVRCQVEKRLRVDRCYKCWSYDNKATECKGPDRSRSCHKCGEDGHEAK